MDSKKSISNIKTVFIRSQVRFLSAPIQPTTQWEDRVPEPEEDHLGDKIVQDAIAKGADRSRLCIHIRAR